MNTAPLDHSQRESWEHGFADALISKLRDDVSVCSGLNKVKDIPGALARLEEIKEILRQIHEKMQIESGVLYNQGAVHAMRREDANGNRLPDFVVHFPPQDHI
jgi:hypothetical protein